MSFMRTAGGALLLAIGIPVLLAGGTLWTVADHRDDGGAFAGRTERLETAGHAVVVPDLDGLLRRDAPFVRAGRTRLRITARSGAGPAFLGVAPAADVDGYLAPAAHARVERVSVTRGPLPVRASDATPAQPGASLAPPDTRGFWRQSGVGVLDLDSRWLRQRSLSLVVMRPDGGAGLAVDVRAEVRLGWLDPTIWGLLAGGLLLVLGAAVILTRPIRPREVVFVVEPDQVPVLAARLGVGTLDPAVDPPGARTVRPRADPTAPRRARPGGGSSVGRVGAGEAATAGRGSKRRPTDLADLLDGERQPVVASAATPVLARPVPPASPASPVLPVPPAWPSLGRAVCDPPPLWPAPVVERTGTQSPPAEPPSPPLLRPSVPLASEAPLTAGPPRPADGRLAAGVSRPADERLAAGTVNSPHPRWPVPPGGPAVTGAGAAGNMGRTRWWSALRGGRPARSADRV